MLYSAELHPGVRVPVMSELPDRRRSSDRELGELSAAYRGLVREMELDRKQRDAQHQENKDARKEDSEKMDAVIEIVPTVVANDLWIKNEGIPAVRTVNQTKWAIRGALGLGTVGVASGTGLLKSALVAVGLMHLP